MAKDIRVKAHLSEPIKANAGLGQTVVVGGTALRPATRVTLGGVIVGEDLAVTQSGVLSVVKANAVEQDNTHPITAAAVYTEIGNIDALLQTI
jgi:hypothetical protein